MPSLPSTCPRFRLNAWLCCALLFLLPGGTSALRANPQDPELKLIQKQIAEKLITVPTPALDDKRINVALAHAGVAEWMKALGADRRWPDIPYEEKKGGAWPPMIHLARVVEMTKAWVNPSNPLHRDPKLRASIDTALGWWLETNPKSTNWFHNEIRGPQYLAQIFILLGDNAIAAHRAESLKRIPLTSKLTGQNLGWMMGNAFMRAVLENDAQKARAARDVIVANLAVTPNEGLQADNSFHQHGPQLNIGNYGLAFAADNVSWAESLRGTSLALGETQLSLLRHFMLKGVNPTIWKGRMDISGCGRQLFAGVPAERGVEVEKLLSSLAKSDPAHADEYRQALKSHAPEARPGEQPTGNTHFWRSDFMVDRRPGYYASVRMNSARTRGTEAINKENVNGAFLGDGALYVYQTGREYEDIFPVWDWRKAPGVTCLDRASTLPSSPNKIRTPATFVGGVSDGVDGVSVFDYNMIAVKSYRSARSFDFRIKKSWFFFDNRIVALGAGLTTEFDKEKDGPIATTLNQCLLNGPVLAGTATGTLDLTKERKSVPDLRWAWHDNISYVLLQPATVTIGGAAQTGSWQKILASATNDPVTKDVFSLWIEHESQPKDGGYAYAILPGVAAAEAAARGKNPGVVVLKNSPQLQAVRADKTVGIVFYEAGELAYADGKSIAADQPCVLLLKEGPAGPTVTVADPEQKLAEITLTLNGEKSVVALPQGLEAGRSVPAFRN